MTKTIARATVAKPTNTFGMDSATQDKLCTVAVAGKGRVERLAAFNNIAPKAYAETATRNELLGSLRLALGSAPTDEQRAFAMSEALAGRVTARLPGDAFPSKGMETADRLAFVRAQIHLFSAPAIEGKAAGKLPAGKLGRRSPVVHKAIRAGEQWVSQLFGELGLTNAQSQGEKNAKQQAKARSAQPGGHDKAKAPAKPSIAEPAKPTTAADVTGYLAVQLATLASYVRKHAAICPADAGTIINRAQREMLACDKATRDGAKSGNIKF